MPEVVGFACSWARDAPATWSGTPWQLRDALRRQARVIDLGIDLPTAPRAAFTLLYARRHGGRWVSNWQHSAAWEEVCRRHLGRRARRAGCQAIVEMGDMTAFDRPFFLVQDLSIDAVLRQYDESSGAAPHFPGLDRDWLQRRRAHQLRVYEQAAGVFTMSEWLARSLVDGSGLPASKVHAVPPGLDRSFAGPDVPPPPYRLGVGPRRRLLFIGRDFYTKGGDLVLSALARLRRQFDPDITLTIAGPALWPLDGLPPRGVRFLGPVPGPRLRGLYDSHDLLLMPSRLEGFGKVFIEALSRGLPVIGRAAYAMPELIRPGINGGLVGGDDPDELAEIAAAVLNNDHIYAACGAQVGDVVGRYTWRRAADDMLSVIDADLAASSGPA